MGLHLEGPFISEKKRGAHIARYVIKPENQLLQEIIEKGKDIVKMITIAPEHFSDEQIKMLLASGIKVSLGHSDCSYERAMQAFDLGVDLVTHLYNAMSPFHHRKPGLVGAALANPNVYTPVILDGIHADFESVKIALKLKKDKLFFISDALFLNNIKQDFKWEEFDAKLINGEYINSDGNLAGANITMVEALQNAVFQLHLNFEEAIEKCTALPAEIIKFRAGKVEENYPAKFISFDSTLQNIKPIYF
ncbi:N-acetylglucosamine-6-phosphate deacetylase [Elizabethkingia sp. JS20170427COW]|uniref:N-acetylglucosamine-6-phosphate deacetylase n=1 Tax=Elizabethkingia sp. JS20170427COW TaxID=2583851 RepID=UPI0011109D52|nr:amidohydrolase family protein [Elizabethkingia sp. JS20170427COW]QCX52285.1 N-acetylglucosamine-6-phosphate deacetylase [Elizabethkingia sp. JS20170427COW]